MINGNSSYDGLHIQHGTGLVLGSTEGLYMTTATGRQSALLPARLRTPTVAALAVGEGKKRISSEYVAYNDNGELFVRATATLGNPQTIKPFGGPSVWKDADGLHLDLRGVSELERRWRSISSLSENVPGAQGWRWLPVVEVLYDDEDEPRLAHLVSTGTAFTQGTVTVKNAAPCACRATSAPPRALKEYEGKYVFVQRAAPDKECSSYYDGEYVIVQQSPHMLYGVKPEVGWNGHELKSFPLVGEARYSVIGVHEDWDSLQAFVDEQIAWADGELAAPTRRWVETVYTEAKRIAQQVQRVIDAHTAAGGCSCG